MQNLITSLGAGTGIDTLALVDQLTEIERSVPQQRLDKKEELLKAQLSDFGILRSAFSTLEQSLEVLGDPDTFDAKSLSFPDTNLIVPEKLEADALSGSYQLEVSQIARAQSLSSGAFSDPNDAVGEGTLTIRFGSFDAGITTFTEDTSKTGGTITIDSSNNSLTGLRDAINNSDLGVQASIIYDGTNYRLLISAPSGEKNEVEIVVAESGGTPSNNDGNDLSRFAFNITGAQLNEEQSGQDAQLKVNGLSVTRESNQIDDVIQGLKFTIANSSLTEVVNLSITEDKNIPEQSVRDFVAVYNTFLETVGKLTGFDSELEDYGSLKTDPLARNLLARLRSVIGAAVPGISGGFTSLTNIGIRTERDGSLSIDEKDFATGFDDNIELVKAIFTPRTSSDSSLVEVTGFSSRSVPGTYAVNITNTATNGSLLAGLTAGFPIDTTGKDYSFDITVDGVASTTLTLPDTTVYNSSAELEAALQSLINNDANLLAANASLTVAFVTDHFEFTSNSLGSNSNVSVSVIGADSGELGLSVQVGTAGSNVAGTIDNLVGFTLGNVLLPKLGSDAEGLSLRVAPGATTASITFSRGFAGELSLVINDFLKTSGLISQREASIRSDLNEVGEDNDKLDRRIEAFRARLQSQFIASERIIRSLQIAGTFFENLADTLPFTSGK